MHNPHTTFYRFLLPLSISLFFAIIPFFLGQFIVPIGEGIDELGHIDHVRWELLHHKEIKNIRESLRKPGYAPFGEGHQPFFSYWISSLILRAFVQPSEVAPLYDYQAGITFSSEGVLYGGVLKNKIGTCSNGLVPINSLSTSGANLQTGIFAIRAFNAVVFALSIFCVFCGAYLLSNKDYLISISSSILYAGIPSALSQSIFINNDNLTSLFGALFGVYAGWIIYSSKSTYAHAIGIGIITGFAFLSKYNAIQLLPVAVILPFLIKEKFSTQLFKSFIIFVTFGLIVFGDLLNNYIIDGDIFSKNAVDLLVPHLVRSVPLSILEVATLPGFANTVIRSLYCSIEEGILLLIPSIKTIIKPSNLWLALLLIAAIGICKEINLKSSQPIHNNIHKKALIVSIIATFISILFCFQVGTEYILAAGRFAHPSLWAICFLIVIGIKNLIPKKYTLIIISLFSIFGSWFVLQNYYNAYATCLDANSNNKRAFVPSGIDAYASDVDSDKNDELLIFRRAELKALAYDINVSSKDITSTNTLNINSITLTLMPNFTSIIGLPGDSILAGDINKDGLSDIALYRKSNELWNIANSIEFTKNRSEVAFNNVQYSSIPSSYEDSRLIGDINGDGAYDLIVYKSQTATWFIRLGNSDLKTLSKNNISMYKFGGSRRTPFLLKTKQHILDQHLLGTYNSKNGETFIGNYKDKTKRLELSLGPNKNILVADLDNNGFDDLISYDNSIRDDNQNCISVVSINPLEASNWIEANNTTNACLPNSIHLDEHTIPIFFKHANMTYLATIDRSTGSVTILSISTNPLAFSITSKQTLGWQ